MLFTFWKVSLLSELATSEILIFQLVSVAEETGLSLALMETPKTGFVASRPILKLTSQEPHGQLNSNFILETP